MKIKLTPIKNRFRKNQLKHKSFLNSARDISTKFIKAIEDLFITFLPFTILITILNIFNQTSIPRADYPFLVATLYTEAAWKSKDMLAKSPSDKSCAILLGVVGALLSTIAATLLLLIELDVITQSWIPHIYEQTMRITFWGFNLGLIYAIYIRYRVL